jgi:hypothetical protein
MSCMTCLDTSETKHDTLQANLHPGPENDVFFPKFFPFGYEHLEMDDSMQ